MSFLSPRIAPFRTRTLHVPQHFHTLPTPNAQTVASVRTSLPDMLSFRMDSGSVYDRNIRNTEDQDGDENEGEVNSGDGRPTEEGMKISGENMEGGRERERDRGRGRGRGRDVGIVREREEEEEQQGRSVEGATPEGSAVQQDSIISLLPTVSRMMSVLQPQLEAAAKIAVDVSNVCWHVNHEDKFFSRFFVTTIFFLSQLMCVLLYLCNG